MIRRILILLFAFISFNLSGQGYYVADTLGNIYYKSGYFNTDTNGLIINSGKYLLDDGLIKAGVFMEYSDTLWINNIMEDYDNLNPHFSNDFRTWSLASMRKVLQSDYVDSSTTGYYWDTFGPSGQNRQEADFIFIFQHDGDFSTLGTNDKTGSTPRHNVGGKIYNQVNTPTNTYTGDDYYVCSTTDSLIYFTGLSFDRCNFTGEMPYIGGDLIRILFQVGNQLEGIFYVPATAFTTVYSNNAIQSPANQFSGFYNYDFINADLGACLFIGNDLSLVAEEGLFEAIEVYFDPTATTPNTPIKNLNVDVSGGTNAALSAAALANIALIQGYFSTAGFTFTATYN